jgi:hypothetical protein
MWYVLFGGGGEDVLIPIAVYSVYIRGPPIQKFGDGTDCKAGTTKERPRGCGLTLRYYGTGFLTIWIFCGVKLPIGSKNSTTYY